MSILVSVLMQMAGLIALGWFWQIIKPDNLNITQVRQVLTSLVYYICLPALIIVNISSVSFSYQSIFIPFTAYTTILLNLFLGWLLLKSWLDKPQLGALLLASAFPNATYLGLPVLQALMGDHGIEIVIQYDFLAALPLLLTVGIGLAQFYGHAQQSSTWWQRLKQLLYTPALQAALIALFLYSFDISLLPEIKNILTALANMVIPIMLLVLGMSLEFKYFSYKNIIFLLIVTVFQLVWMPLVALFLLAFFQMEDLLKQGILLEAAMPTMLIGLVICEKYGLDTKLYAAALAITTLLSFFSLPFWFSLIINN